MKKGKIRINEDRCKGCMLCIEACKFNELKQSDRVNKYGHIVVEFCGKGKCTACALCAIVCPDAAIEVFEIVESKDERK